MWGSITSWIASLPWRPATVLVGTILLTWAVSGILDRGVGDKDTRDIGIVVVCVAAVVGFFVALVFSPWVRGQTIDQTNGTSVAAEAAVPRLPLRYEFQGWIESWATGELTVGEVQPLTLVTGAQIDYHPRSFGADYEQMISMARLRLAEVALLRRLGVAENQTQESWRCEAALRAGGLSDPGSALARLHDMKLITTDGSVVNLTDLGRDFVLLSSQCLLHFPVLTAAYRHVARQINKTVRFDGRPLS